MITYLAIRITNGDYYWGSTVNLKEREYRHRLSKAEDWFHRSLRKYPEEWVFIPVWEEEDPKRSREQSLLDLHYGRKGCLNLSPRAGGGIQPGGGFKVGKENICHRPEVIAKYEEARKRRGGKPYNVDPKYKKPWANAAANKEDWAKSPEYLSSWIENGRPGDAKLSRLLGVTRGTIRKMVKLFQSGWVPTEDPYWVEYFRSE